VESVTYFQREPQLVLIFNHVYKSQIHRELGRFYPNPQPSGIEIAWKLGMSNKYVVLAQDGGRFPSLGASVPPDAIEEILRTLTHQEEKVIRMRFAIGEKSTSTLKKVGERFSVSGERIRQIQVRTLRKLRYAIHFVKPITHF